tara:strand:+ start:460 stop:579 length:120 start_codon:yes stop_codon:yes gene_type:complete
MMTSSLLTDAKSAHHAGDLERAIAGVDLLRWIPGRHMPR